MLSIAGLAAAGLSWATWPASASADVSGEVNVLVRVTGGSLPVTGGDWQTALWAGMLVLAGVVLFSLRRKRPAAMALGLGGLMAVGVLAGALSSAAAAPPDPDVTITIDRDSGLTGSAQLSLDVSALDSKVYRVDAAIEARRGIAFSFAGVELGQTPVQVGEADSQSATGVVPGTLAASIPAALSAGEYRVKLTYTGIDERILIDQVSAVFPDRAYDGSTAATPQPGSVVVAGIVPGDDVTLQGLRFAADSKDAGTRQVTASANSLGGADSWRYRLATTIWTGQSLTISPKPLTFTGSLTASKLAGVGDPVELAGSSLRVENANAFTGLVPGEGFSLGVSGELSVNFGTEQEVVEPEPVSATGGVFTLADPAGGASAANYSLSTPSLLGEVVQPIELEVTVSASGQRIGISHYWTNSYTVDWGDNSLVEWLQGDPNEAAEHSYSAPGTYTVTLTSELSQVQRWTWLSGDAEFETLVRSSDTTAANVAVSAFPKLRAFQPEAGVAEDNFFYRFNGDGALASLPAGSFDTSEITQTGVYFFNGFNATGALTSLPAGSFDISNITEAGDFFFAEFCGEGELTSLPAGSFDFSGITQVPDYFFYGFNTHGTALTSLPAGSFDTSKITEVGDYFFNSFNHMGSLPALPAGSFDTSNITEVGSDFFDSFNDTGQLINLPTGSFDISSVVTEGGDFFRGFNYMGKIVELPAGSFHLSRMESTSTNFFTAFDYLGALQTLPAGSFNTERIEDAGTFFFAEFNYQGALTELPAGSFRLDGVVVAGQDFFDAFNYQGALTTLPAGSFNTSHITEVGAACFEDFNNEGSLTALPENSFDTSGLRLVREGFFANFNLNGDITYLPASFKWPADPNPVFQGAFMHSFDSPNATLNVSAAELVSGVKTPTDMRYTFSSNQPDWDKLSVYWRAQ
ncbi:MAG: YDG domain-containing protein [Propionibacteriaceae bacterium]|jgi:LPXTG-motif cell wall-anchored protein|nr:YDG domain-containing protein [Propionibacteriaceae bacterium]